MKKLILFFAFCTSLVAQNEFEMPIKITGANGLSTSKAIFGIKNNATNNLDTLYDEYDVPPLYQGVLGELFHFYDNAYQEEILSYKDFRPNFKSGNDSIVFNLEVANLGQSYNIEWGEFPEGIKSVTMRSKFYSVSYDYIDMIANKQINITNSAITDLVIVLKNNTADVQDISDEFNIFPNPCNDYIHISSKQTIKSILLHNVFGDLIEVNSEDKNTIETKALPSGIYYLMITDENNSVIRKKIIKL